MKIMHKFTILFIFTLLLSPVFASEIDSYELDSALDKNNYSSIDMEESSVLSEEDNEIVVDNSRRSFDPDQYEYTFGLIPPEKLNINFASHLYTDTTMLYGYPTLGVTWDMGINVDTVTIAAYLRYSHFFKPLGSTTGRLAVAEEFGEAGISFKVRIYELGRFNVNIGINTSWYQQWLMLASNIGTYNLVNNGLMIRPEASIGWNWVGWWTMELGLFYQTPLYPSYKGYQGWGVYIKIV